MKIDKPQISGMNTRQKVTLAVTVIVFAVIAWQVFSMFRGSPTTTPTIANNTPATNAAPNGNTPNGKAGPQAVTQPTTPVPQQARLLPQPAMTPREMELMRLQQETQAKYVAALNELQMLKISREIAETDQAIAAARLAKVTAEKGIVDLLAPPAPPPVPQGAYAQGLLNPGANNAQAQGKPQPTEQEASYTVVSVSQLQYKWSAVLGFQGNLYHVSVGDVLPLDGSMVASIDKSGVTLRLKDRTTKRISLVPII